MLLHQARLQRVQPVPGPLQEAKSRTLPQVQDLTPGTAELFPAGLTPLCSFTVLPCPLVGVVESCERTSTEELLLPPPPQQTGVHAALVLTALCLAEVKQSKLLWQGNTVLSGGTQVQPTLEDLGSVDTSCFASSEGRGSRAPSDHLDLSSNEQKPLFYHKGKRKGAFLARDRLHWGCRGSLWGSLTTMAKHVPPERWDLVALMWPQAPASHLLVMNYSTPCCSISL